MKAIIIKSTGLSGDEFHFDSNGDGPARYNILHFKQVARGEYRWVKVGRYLDGELELRMEGEHHLCGLRYSAHLPSCDNNSPSPAEVQFKWESRSPPESVCSAECELGQAKQYVEGERCCWHCFNCTQYEVSSEGAARSHLTSGMSITDPHVSHRSFHRCRRRSVRCVRAARCPMSDGRAARRCRRYTCDPTRRPSSPPSPSARSASCSPREYTHTHIHPH